MDLKIIADPAHVGDLFRASIRYKFHDELFVTLRFITARVIGMMNVNGNKLKILESVPVQLPVGESTSKATYRCTIPREALPSIRCISFEIEYSLLVEVYHSNMKTVESKVFEVYPLGSGCTRGMMTGTIVIHADMIRTDDAEDTAFSTIVKYLRNGFKCEAGTIDRMVENKICLLGDISNFMNRVVEEYRMEGKGDVYFYVSDEEASVEGGMRKVSICDSGGEVARIEHRRLFVEDDLLVIYYARDVRMTKIFMKITEYVNNEITSDTEELLKEFDSSACAYKVIPIVFDPRSFFSFDCGLLAIRVFYKVVLDNLEFELPVNKISPRARVSMD